MVGLGVLELVAVHGAGAAVRRNPRKTVGTRVDVRRYPMSKGKGEAPERW